jgi:glycosyltransferase involved in cell wall biosynthesis
MNYKNSKEIFIKKYNIPEDFTIFAIVGRIDYTQKDYLTVIKALKVLKNYTRKFRLIIVGNGLDMNRLKRDVQINDLEKEVIYTGFINNVENIYKSVDCLIFSTKYEGFALVILEAMSYNLNIIASDIDTTKEIIQDRYNGLLFTMGDSDNLSQLLIKNIYNLQNKLFIKGIKNTINNFTEEIMLKKVENEYNK